MGKVRTELVILAVLLILLFWMRMAISTASESLSYDSYLTVRQVEHIKETGTPLKSDPLSVTGAKRVTNPVFDYLLAGSLFISPMMYKILPNLFMVLLLVPVFFLTRRLTQSDIAGFLAVILAGSGPVVFAGYLNTPSPAPLGIFLLLSIVAMLHDPDKNIFLIIICAILLTFLSPLIFLLSLALLAIILLLRVEGFGIDRRVNELFFFTLLLALWFYVIIFKQALFSQGIQVLWQNLPTEVVRLSFRNITFLDTIGGLGVVTFLFGVFGVYHALFETQDRSSYTIIGALIAVTIAVLLRVVPLDLGLLLLTIFFAIMAGYGVVIIYNYFTRTKFPWMRYFFAGLLLVLFLITAALPSLVAAKAAMQDGPTSDDIATFTALRERLPPDAILLTPVDEAAAIQYYSGRVTLTDQDFLLVHNGEELVKDIDAVYTSRFSSTVVNLAQKHGFTNILFTRAASAHYERPGIYATGQCIGVEQSNNAILYSITCAEGSS